MIYSNKISLLLRYFNVNAASFISYKAIRYQMLQNNARYSCYPLLSRTISRKVGTDCKDKDIKGLKDRYKGRR